MVARFRLASILTFAALISVVAFVFDSLLDSDNLPAWRDLLFFVVPFKHFLGSELRGGHLPLWNPWIYAGTPFLAGLQTGVFYPISFLLVLPFPLGFNAFLLAHYLIALGGMWLMLRARRLSLLATAIGSLTFVIGGYLVSMMNVTNHLQSAVWIPWVFYGGARFSERHSFGRFSFLVIALVLELLGGSPEAFLLTLGLLFAAFVYDFHDRLIEAPGAFAGLALSIVCVAGLCAFQILPTLEYLGESARAQAFSVDQASNFSLHPVSLLQLLFPHSSNLVQKNEMNSLDPGFLPYIPWIESIYLGIPPLCLAIAGLARARDRRFWGASLVIGTVLALGDHTPIFPIVYELAPRFFGKFRYPEKFFLIIHFACAVLAAEGAEGLVTADLRTQRIARTAAATLLLVGCGIAALRWLRPFDYVWSVGMLAGRPLSADALTSLAFDVMHKCQRMLLILGTFLAVLALVERALIARAVGCWLVVALAAADLASAQRNLNRTISWSMLARQPFLVEVDHLQRSRGTIFHYQLTTAALVPANAQPIAGLKEWVAPIGPGLEEVLDLWRASYSHVGMLHGVGNLSSVDGIDRESMLRLRLVLEILPREKAVALLRPLGVAYLIGPTPLDLPSIEPVAPKEPSAIYVYRIKNPVPFTYLVQDLRVAPSALEAFNALIRQDFPAGAAAVVEEMPAGWLDDSAKDAGGIVRVEQFEPDHLRLHVEASRPSFAVVNQSFFPGWEATVDGFAVEIFRANALMRGVSVAAGRHTIDFTYRPASFRIGAYISSVFLIGLAAVALIAGLRRRAYPR